MGILKLLKYLFLQNQLVNWYSFSVEEGDVLPQDVLVGYIDTIPLSIKREELMVAREMVVSKSRSYIIANRCFES